MQSTLRRFPALALTLGVIATAVSLMLVTWLLFVSSSNHDPVTKTALELARLKGEILRLDEVLTMSARMNASTGDDQWEKRYFAHVAPLDAAIKRVLEIVPESSILASAQSTERRVACS